MRGSRMLLLLVILLMGASVETAYQVREQVGVGPFGWRLFGGKFGGPHHSFEERGESTLAGGTPVAIDNSFGDVEVTEGPEGRAEVVLRKVVYIGSETRAAAFAERVRLELRTVDGRMRVGTNRSELERASDAFDVGFETHLLVRLPAKTALVVNGSHGDASIRGTGETRIENDFGDVTARGVSRLTVNVGHGGLDVEGVGGELDTSVRHGDTRLRDVAGRARVTSEHGDVSTERTGALTVNVKHGALRAQGVLGDLEVLGEHAGVVANAVTGSAKVETGFEAVALTDIGGNAKVRLEHGDLECARIKGALAVEVSFGAVRLEQITGFVEATASRGGVHGTALQGGARIKSDGDDVVVDGFSGELSAEASRGAVQLDPLRALSSNVTATASFGDVQLRVPEGSRFALSAEVERGLLEIELPELRGRQESAGKLSAQLGSGGGRVTLRAEHGDVRVARQAPD